MIEREVAVASERPLVASVIYNRLHAGMRLDIDATVQYAIGQWKPDLTAADLATDSPYNTRRFARPAAGADRQPGQGQHPCRGASRADAVPLLRGPQRRQRAPLLLAHARRSSTADVARSQANGGTRMAAIDARTRIAGIIGWPVEHSLSPAMHNAAFAALGLNWAYAAFPVAPRPGGGGRARAGGGRLRGA